MLTFLEIEQHASFTQVVHIGANPCNQLDIKGEQEFFKELF
jgi:hypothetical protein